MVVFSSFRPIFQGLSSSVLKKAATRTMSDHRTFRLRPSTWQWTVFKDHLHFYVMLGLIPCSVAITLANIFIGPATLSEIPEGYVPKYWEYYKSPVTRFIARYILPNPQQDYEKHLHFIFEEDERLRLRKLESDIRNKMAERQDYQAYYYRPVLAKYHRVSREAADYLESISGE